MGLVRQRDTEPVYQDDVTVKTLDFSFEANANMLAEGTPLFGVFS